MPRSAFCKLSSKVRPIAITSPTDFIDAANTGQAAVGDHLAAAADVVRRGHQVEVADRVRGADDEVAAGRQRAADRAGDVVRREPGLVDERVELARHRSRRPPARRRARPGRRCRPRPGPCDRGDGVRPGPGRGRVEHLDAVARRAAAAPAGTVWGGRRPPPARPGRPARWPAAAGRSAAPGRCAPRSTARPAAASRRAPRAIELAARRRRRRPRPCGGRASSSVADAARSALVASVSGAAHLGRPPVPGHQRVVELDVEVHQTGQRPQPGRVHVDRRHLRPEDPDLVGGLVGVGAAQPQRPVGGDHHQRHPGVVGLEHRRVQVRHRGARRAHHRGPRPALGQPEGEEPGGPLVDPGVQPEQPGLGGVVRRERERRVPRTRRQHHLADAVRDQRGDDRARDARWRSQWPAPRPAGPPSAPPGRPWRPAGRARADRRSAAGPAARRRPAPAARPPRPR